MKYQIFKILIFGITLVLLVGCAHRKRGVEKFVDVHVAQGGKLTSDYILDIDLRYSESKYLYGGRFVYVEGDESKSELFEDPPGTKGLVLLGGVHHTKSQYGTSLQSGIGYLTGEKSGFVIPIEVEGNFRLFGIVGGFLKTGFNVSTSANAGPIFSGGIIILPWVKWDFNGR